MKQENANRSLSRVGAVGILALAIVLSGCAGPPAAQNSGGNQGGEAFAVNEEVGIEDLGGGSYLISSTPATESVAVNQAARAALPASVLDAGVLKVGGATDNVPMMFVDGGELQGIDIDMMGGLARVLGIKIALQKTSFDSMIPGLQSKRIDVAMGDFTDTKARQEVVDFVDYNKNGQILLTGVGNPEGIKGPDDLCGLSAAGAKGTLSANITESLSDRCVKDGQPAIEIQSYAGSPGLVTALQAGRADAAVVSYANAVYLVDEGGLEMVGDLFFISYKGAAVRKDDTQLRDALALAFQAFLDTDNYTASLSNWKLDLMRNDKVTINSAAEEL